ncbi:MULTISPECIES: hypothetical protein [Methanobacterium]|uniref:Uncharacterized protein n=1 Tax=Methanobacterium bryantii TaxID=2161 RepID=A0A2A2H6M0_METBR|nr:MULTISPECIES: hypothetical protein [Methanobacterium]OEC85891.1 hypothetical protein A9507_12680 [Methanobacterium sp. A39]PAV04954.1 hypothetical protein ASJ80_11660 [Methanobacterium bryantii]
MGISIIYRKRKSSKKTDERLSSLRREFNYVKEESFNEIEDDWLENRLNADDPDLEDLINVNKK